MDNKAKILIVDDRDSWSDFARKTLSDAGFMVVVDDASQNGNKESLMRYFDSFDLIILDLIKSKHDSMNILGTACGSITPKLAVTSNPTIPVVREVMKNGADNFSPKPYDEVSLLRIVRESLKS